VNDYDIELNDVEDEDVIEERNLITKGLDESTPLVIAGIQKVFNSAGYQPLTAITARYILKFNSDIP